ncbi:MAG: c-type cytochrome biogenesis protein CcsB [Deltaproteobacteria bacterium]|nr:c-type cytochrome biogenesis protein CcsB [Deltaproteobacteria bacterium]
MADIFFMIALFLILLSTGGFIVFIIKQKERIFFLSYIALCAGFILQSISLVLSYYDLGVAPVISLKSSLSFFAWCIIGVYLVFHARFRLMVLGSFAAPLAAVLMIISSVIPGAEAGVNPILRSAWLIIHVVTIFIGNGIFAITFVSAVMYIIQESRIKKKSLGSFYKRLPSLETLDSINHYTIIYGFPFLTIGMITGTIYAYYALGSYWRWDPKEVWTLVTWLAFAVLLHERLAAGWRGRKAALMSIICFLMLIFTFLAGSLWLSDYHSFRNLGAVAGI